MGGGTIAARPKIVVTPERTAGLARDFERTWGRPPSDGEREELRRDWVREEVLCREARSLGLDRDDPTVRHQLRQIMEVLVEEEVEPREPTDEDLAAYLKEHPEQFGGAAGGWTPALDEVRDSVRRRWTIAERKREIEAAYERLEARYDVVVEREGAGG